MTNFPHKMGMMKISASFPMGWMPLCLYKSSGVNLVWNLGRSWTRVKKFRFSRKIFEKFRFFQAISQTKNRFFRANFRKISLFQV